MKRPVSASASPGLHCRNDTLTYRDTTAWVLPGSDQMRVFWQPIAKLSQAETRLFASILTIAALLLAFGLLAEEVIEGETLPFDRKLLLALRQAGNPGVPIGPPWLPEAARDISALGSTIVLGILLLAVVGYCPGRQDAIYGQPKIIMEPTGIVFLNDKDAAAITSPHSPDRFARFRKNSV